MSHTLRSVMDEISFFYAWRPSVISQNNYNGDMLREEKQRANRSEAMAARNQIRCR